MRLRERMLASAHLGKEVPMKLSAARTAIVVAGVLSLALIAAPGASASGHGAARRGTQIACGPSHVAVISTHRTKTSAWTEERVTEPVCHRVSTGNGVTASHLAKTGIQSIKGLHERLTPGVLQGECNTYEEIGLRNNNTQIFARAWLANCTGESACSKYATIQQKEDSPEQGNWEDVKSGNNADGCTAADYAWVDGNCYAEPTTVFSYRPRGVFTIVWDDGSISQPVENGASIGGYKLACG
jgi:hypothetical protein